MENRGDYEAERRENRRKRRQRNQVLAYLFLLILIAGIAAAVIFGVKLYSQRQPEENPEEKSSELDSLFESEEPIVMQTSQPEPQEPSKEERLDALIDETIGAMTLEDKVAGLFFVTPESITGVSTAVQAGEGTKDALAKYAVGGIVYFAKNIQSADQLKTMISNTRSYARYPLFIGVDEEGGSVSRVAGSALADNEGSAEAIGATGDPNNAYLAGSAIGAYLSPLGFDLDFAPVADLANVEGSAMKERSYGADAAAAAPFVAAMVRGLEEQGITACLKHFPGNGGTAQDTHNGIVVNDRTEEQFRAEEFAVFREGIDAGAKMVMVGHMAVPSLAGDQTPACMSESIVKDILRGELDFDGVIITDAMNMASISEYYDSGQAAVLALKAGCDMILMPDDFEKAYGEVLQSVAEGVISQERVEDSLRRIYRIKYAGRVE